jgi:hypothetical protein
MTGTGIKRGPGTGIKCKKTKKKFRKPGTGIKTIFLTEPE